MTVILWQADVFVTCSVVNTTTMGVNATGTLGGSQVERRRRENRGTIGGEGVWSGEGLCPFPENL